jgi:hypothetical protein
VKLRGLVPLWRKKTFWSGLIISISNLAFLILRKEKYCGANEKRKIESSLKPKNI